MDAGTGAGTGVGVEVPIDIGTCMSSGEVVVETAGMMEGWSVGAGAGAGATDDKSWNAWPMGVVGCICSCVRVCVGAWG